VSLQVKKYDSSGNYRVLGQPWVRSVISRFSMITLTTGYRQDFWKRKREEEKKRQGATETQTVVQMKYVILKIYKYAKEKIVGS
jgi:hypothetical protein